MLKDFLRTEDLSEEFNSIKHDIRSGIPTAIFGVGFSEKNHLASIIDAPVLYIVKDNLYALKVQEELSAFTNSEVVYLPAKDDVLLYKTAFDKTCLYNRLTALYKIQNGAKYIVSTFESLLQLVPKSLPVLNLKKGESYEIDFLVSQLVEFGYERKEFAEEKGTFALRGDIFEVCPINTDYSYRIDFFGDEIESIYKYKIEEKQNKSLEKNCVILCATDILIKDEEIDFLKTRVKDSLSKFKTLIVKDDARIIADEIREKLDSDKSSPSLQFIMPLLSNCSNDITSYLDENTTVIFDECKMLADNLSAIIKEHTERCLTLSRSGKAFDFTIKQIADSDVLIRNLQKFKKVAVQNVTTVVNFFNPLKTYSLKYSPVSRYSIKPEDLFTDVSNWKFGGYKVIICCGNAERANRLKEDFSSKGIAVLLSDNSQIKHGMAIVTSYFLPSGFICHTAKTVVIGTGDIYISIKEQKRIKKRRGDLFQAPEVGDYAVHEVHGIGYVKGIQRITTQEGSKDYVAVEYYGGDILYVSVDQMDKLTKYMGGGEKPTLNKIGGKEFDRIKERARESISKMTINLKQLYSARKEKKGFVFSDNTNLCEEFDNAFEFEPTEDQIQSEKEIFADMESGKVMDRLLCGDVGFGKTEVALRAAYKAVLDGKQVALVCPTTILCEQHYRTAVKRFEDFGVNVASLNRFKSSSEQSRVLSKLKSGDIDLVVGTHRLFGNDVKFKDLGLLILDEEQRFGVEHKEKLKVMKENVDTITMTATPIPRTLHMSLTGIRDISTINTPPSIRIPVQTYVAEESDALITDAIRREVARAGQVLIMYNRVETIYKFADSVKSLLPDLRIVVAHGQMDKKVLENSVLRFYDGEYDVLIATTIIENGIDLPRANTLIVIDSDKLGLSTLYQLKGRVGRSNVMAHAYFTFKRDKVISDTAYKRLSAIMEFTDMGSGYKIAMRDLEIRGAGNVLGKEQHGHMDKIGYELYSKLLKESLGETVKNYDTELDIKMDAFIPDDYIYSSVSRMDCYKQIAEIADSQDEDRIIKSLSENYGTIPHEVNNLILIAKLKLQAHRHGAIKVVVGERTAYVELNGLDSLKEEGYLDRIDKFKDFATLTFAENPKIIFKTIDKDSALTADKMLNFFCF